MLRWSEHARRLRDRLATLHRVFGDDWPDVSDAALLADPDRWWIPALARARSRADLARIDAATVLRALLDHRHAARLDELAPERIEVPSGSRIAVDYSADQPVLAVKVQEVFGWTATPTVADGRLAGRVAPAVPGGQACRGHRGPDVVLGHRLSAGARRAAGPLPQARVARRSTAGAAETTAQAWLTPMRRGTRSVRVDGRARWAGPAAGCCCLGGVLRRVGRQARRLEPAALRVRAGSQCCRRRPLPFTQISALPARSAEVSVKVRTWPDAGSPPTRESDPAEIDVMSVLDP